MAESTVKDFTLYDNFLSSLVDFNVKVIPSVTTALDYKLAPVNLKLNSAVVTVIVVLSIAVILRVSESVGVYLQSAQVTNLPSILMPIAYSISSCAVVKTGVLIIIVVSVTLKTSHAPSNPITISYFPKGFSRVPVKVITLPAVEPVIGAEEVIVGSTAPNVN